MFNMKVVFNKKTTRGGWRDGLGVAAIAEYLDSVSGSYGVGHQFQGVKWPFLASVGSVGCFGQIIET